MKIFTCLLIFMAAGLGYSSEDEKDHSQNARRIASLSYYLADSSEVLAVEANQANFYGIYQESEGVHKAASNLYHLARRQNPGVPSYRLGQAFDAVSYEYEQLESYFHKKNHALDSYWYNVQTRYRQLCNLMVNGFGLKDHRCD